MSVCSSTNPDQSKAKRAIAFTVTERLISFEDFAVVELDDDLHAFMLGAKSIL